MHKYFKALYFLERLAINEAKYHQSRCLEQLHLPSYEHFTMNKNIIDVKDPSFSCFFKL